MGGMTSNETTIYHSPTKLKFRTHFIIKAYRWQLSHKLRTITVKY